MSKKHKTDNSPSVPQREKIKENLRIREFKWTPKQEELIKLILDKETKVVFINGPAGSAKSLTSLYCGLKLLNDKKVSNITFVRTVIESASRSLGYLKGDLGEKFEPFLLPLREKCEELISESEINKLFQDKRIDCIPIGFLRGASMNVCYTWADEISNFTTKEIITLLTRIGKFSKLILTGDERQCDIGNSGFRKIIDIFNDEESRRNGIHYFEFNKDDIMRSETCKYIVEKLDRAKI